MILPLTNQGMKTNKEFKEKYDRLSKQCKNIRAMHQSKIKKEMTMIQKEYVHSIAFSLEVINNRIYE